MNKWTSHNIKRLSNQTSAKKKKKKKKKLDQKNDNKNIIKYKTEIEDITKHACYCCKTLCFAFKIHVVSKLF